MIDQITITHHIQKHIIGTLLYKDVARFRDLRPPKTDTNLFSYHLGVLMKAGFVKKLEKGYGLSQNGLTYVDRMSTEKMSVRSQPKIISMLVVQNSEGDLLLQKRDKQPYINAWTLPYGKIHIDDTSVEIAAMREANEKLGLINQKLTHAGDAYIRVYNDTELLSTTLAHVFRFNSDEIVVGDTLVWARPHKLSQYKLAPAVEEIAARTFFNDPIFFEEYNVQWKI